MQIYLHCIERIIESIKAIRPKSYLLTLFIFATQLLSGCATVSLWDSSPAETQFAILKKSHAETDQIYVSYDKVEYATSDSSRLMNATKYAIPFQLSQQSKPGFFDFPTIAKGYLLITDLDSQYYRYDENKPELWAKKRYGDLSKFLEQIDLISLDVVKVKEPSFFADSSVELNVIFKDSNKISSSFRDNGWPLTPYKRRKDIRSLYGKSVGLNLRQNDSLSYSFCCLKADLIVTDKIETSGKLTLLTHNNKTPLPLDFYLIEENKGSNYRYPLASRIVLTPFSIVLDVVTFPIQLLLLSTAEYWMPR